ncbi:MAG: PorT family protein [Hymenobacteraceae bacterium]|nr:PorT family protein [Hymenobacteraceae bacterium]
MKKSLCLTLITLLLLCPVLVAQAQYYRFGGKAGGGFSRAKGDDASSSRTNYLAGLNAGFVFSYDFPSVLAIQPELLYSQKGFVYDEYILDQNEALSGEVRLHYIELPLMLRLQQGGLFLEAGPYGAYLLNKDSEVDRISTFRSGSNPLILGPYELNIDDFERFDYGYSLGFGIMLETGFYLSIRNTGGLRSFSKTFDQKNLMWQLSIGYLRPSRRPVDMM